MSNHAEHQKIETSNFLMIVLILLTVVASVASSRSSRCSSSPPRSRSRASSPYTPLQLAGRDIYIREGCYNCHSQMIRPFRPRPCAMAVVAGG